MPGEPDFDLAKWYCIVCPCDPRAMSYANANTVKQHVLQDHTILEPKEGKHFTQGWAARKLWNTRVWLADRDDDHDIPALADPNFSLDDFKAECLSRSLLGKPEPPCEKQPLIQRDKKKGKRRVG